MFNVNGCWFCNGLELCYVSDFYWYDLVFFYEFFYGEMG